MISPDLDRKKEWILNHLKQEIHTCSGQSSMLRDSWQPIKISPNTYAGTKRWETIPILRQFVWSFRLLWVIDLWTYFYHWWGFIIRKFLSWFHWDRQTLERVHIKRSVVHSINSIHCCLLFYSISCQGHAWKLLKNF